MFTHESVQWKRSCLSFQVISKEHILNLYSLKQWYFLLKYHQNHSSPYTTEGTEAKVASEVTNDVAATRKWCLIIVPAVILEKFSLLNLRQILFKNIFLTKQADYCYYDNRSVIFTHHYSSTGLRLWRYTASLCKCMPIQKSCTKNKLHLNAIHAHEHVDCRLKSSLWNW